MIRSLGYQRKDLDMTGRSYPLETLITLRRRLKEQREHDLAQALKQLQGAEARRQEAELRLEEHSHQLDLRRQQDPDAGTLSVAELQGQDRYLSRLQRELQQLRQARQEALCSQEERHAAVIQSRGELARAEALLQTVQKNFETWDRNRRREEHQRAEKELEDLLMSRS